MPFLIDSYNQLQKELSGKNVTLVAVTKTKPVEDIMEAYNAGHRDFGENYVQELVDKYETLPKDIRWHYIGHLQTNKVKYIAPFIHLIHGVDSEKLLSEISKQAAKMSRTISCLLQVHISGEETKFGMNVEELTALISKIQVNPAPWKDISIKGLMGMASLTEDEERIRSEFEYLRSIFDKTDYPVLSMGMSADYKLAIDEGSTMVRIGSLLFGSRN